MKLFQLLIDVIQYEATYKPKGRQAGILLRRMSVSRTACPGLGEFCGTMRVRFSCQTRFKKTTQKQQMTFSGKLVWKLNIISNTCP